MKKTNFKILVIEDDPAQGMMYQVALSNAGLGAILAATGGAGIASAQAKRPDLIFLDMVLPDMDGLAVLEVLKSDPKTKGIKTIVLSNLNKKETIDQAIRAGAADFLVKMQFLPKEVVLKAKKHLNLMPKAGQEGQPA